MQHEQSKEELLHLGHNWCARPDLHYRVTFLLRISPEICICFRFVHNRRNRSVKAWYEAIPLKHALLAIAEDDQRQLVSTLLRLEGSEVTVVPCLFRWSSVWKDSKYPPPHHASTSHSQDGFTVILHVTLPDINILKDVPLARTRLPVHIYIGNPLLSATDMNAYNAARMTVPPRVEVGDPLFCATTARSIVFSVYLHSIADESLFGLTVGQAVQHDPNFALHRALVRNSRDKSKQDRYSSAFQSLGTVLSSPCPSLIEDTIKAFDSRREQDALRENSSRLGLSKRSQEMALLNDALTRPHELNIGHACAAELSIRPCIESR